MKLTGAEVQEGKLGEARRSYACASELPTVIVTFLESSKATTELKSRFLDDAKPGTRLLLGECGGNINEEALRRHQVRISGGGNRRDVYSITETNVRDRRATAERRTLTAGVAAPLRVSIIVCQLRQDYLFM